MMMDAPRGHNIEQKTDLFIKLIQTESKPEFNWTELNKITSNRTNWRQ